MKNRNKGNALLLGVALAALASPPLAAQAAAQEGANNLPPSVSDIVVTAQRREERAQDVPVVVTAFSPERLEQLDEPVGAALATVLDRPPAEVVAVEGAGNRDPVAQLPRRDHLAGDVDEHGHARVLALKHGVEPDRLHGGLLRLPQS